MKDHSALNDKLKTIAKLIRKAGYRVPQRSVIFCQRGIAGSLSLIVRPPIIVCCGSNPKSNCLSIMVATRKNQEGYPDLDWKHVSIHSDPDILFSHFLEWMDKGKMQPLTAKRCCDQECYIYDPTWHDWAERNKMTMNLESEYNEKTGKFYYTVLGDKRTRTQKVIDTLRMASKLKIGV